MDAVLEIKNLFVALETSDENRMIVRNVSFNVGQGEVVALVGGSGSGKTTTGLSVLRLLAPVLKIRNGEIFFQRQDILRFSSEEMRALRGSKISMIFQEPLNAFNPLFPISHQIDEVLRYHTRLTKARRIARVAELLDLVGIKDTVRVSRSYPHQLSGGMRQRAMIAQAIAADPQLIIADEPTSNLDVTLQARIIQLFKDLRKQLNWSMIMITHDLGMAAHLADQIVVMNQGEVAEQGDAKAIVKNPQHQYTKDLIGAAGL